MSSQPSRIPVKIHRNVSLITTNDAHLSAEILADRRVSMHIIGKLNDQVLLVYPGKAQQVIEALRQSGHTPKTVG